MDQLDLDMFRDLIHNDREKRVREVYDLLYKFCTGLMEDGVASILPSVAVLGLSFENLMNRETEKTSILMHGMNVGFSGKEEKKKAMKFLAARVFKEHYIPLAIALSSEAWMSMCHKDEMEDNNPYKKYLSLEDDPNRIEVILVAALAFPIPSGEDCEIHGVRQVTRDSENKMRWSGENNEESSQGEANILHRFFDAYMRFALKYEDASAYQGMFHQQEIDIRNKT